jgi:hypothetical protein
MRILRRRGYRLPNVGEEYYVLCLGWLSGQKGAFIEVKGELGVASFTTLLRPRSSGCMYERMHALGTVPQSPLP